MKELQSQRSRPGQWEDGAVAEVCRGEAAEKEAEQDQYAPESGRPEGRQVLWFVISKKSFASSKRPVWTARDHWSLEAKESLQWLVTHNLGRRTLETFFFLLVCPSAKWDCVSYSFQILFYFLQYFLFYQILEYHLFSLIVLIIYLASVSLWPVRSLMIHHLNKMLQQFFKNI